MTKPTPEYYKAKADLCERLAIEQIWSGNTDMGMRNLMRMTHALAEIQLTEKEGDDDETAAAAIDAEMDKDREERESNE
jgi:hypothetical protein